MHFLFPTGVYNSSSIIENSIFFYTRHLIFEFSWWDIFSTVTGNDRIMLDMAACKRPHQGVSWWYQVVLYVFCWSTFIGPVPAFAMSPTYSRRLWLSIFAIPRGDIISRNSLPTFPSQMSYSTIIKTFGTLVSPNTIEILLLPKSQYYIQMSHHLLYSGSIHPLVLIWPLKVQVSFSILCWYFQNP